MKKLIDFIFPKICMHCFQRSKKDFFCEYCSEHFIYKKNIFKNKISTFDDIGPSRTFLLEIKKAKIRKLMKLAASFMVIRYFELDNPFPDLIVYYKNTQGVKILANEIGKILRVKSIYKKRRGLEKVFDLDKIFLLVTDRVEEGFYEKNIYVLGFV